MLLSTAARRSSQLAQVGQARFELAQLDVVEAVGRLLAVAGDEGHRGAAVEQLDGGLHLRRPNLQFGGNLQNDLVQEVEAEKAKRRSLKARLVEPEAVRGAGCVRVLRPYLRGQNQKISSVHQWRVTLVAGARRRA